MPTFGVGSFRIIVKRDHDADIVLSGMNEDQYPNRTFLSVLWKTKIILRIMKIFSQSILGLFLFCFVLFFFFLIIIIIIHWAQGKSLIIFWPFDSLPWCWILPTISLHCHKQNKYHGRVTKIQLVLLLNLIGWERGAITLWDSISLGLRWTLNLNWFQSILQKKNRYKDILIHMVLTLITAWRQRRTFSRTFNVIDLKNALVRKNYSLGNWV